MRRNIPQARFMIGMNAYHLGEYAKAAQIFSALPPTYDVLVNLGASLAAAGDAAAAMTAWRRALDANPIRNRSSVQSGILGLPQEEWELASSRLAQFLQEHPRDTRGRVSFWEEPTIASAAPKSRDV